MADNDVFDYRLQCFPNSLGYDFCKHNGQLNLPAPECCDMGACVALFQAIDPKVLAIVVWSGDEIDISYRLVAGKWKASDLRGLRL